MKILVGMSGGVDSSVAALLLKQQGHDVIGVTMSIWDTNSKIKSDSSKNSCFGADEKEDIMYAKQICDEIGIEHYVFDCVEEYQQVVLENFRDEYLSGRTPNPCVRCNSKMKFDVLPYMAEKAGIKFDKFATGHYARCDYDSDLKKHILKRGINPKKDQSYFLYRLKQEQLAKSLLPLGSYYKEEIRDIARKNNLSVADKPDSQDFFNGNYNELLKVEDKIGNIVDINGNILGEHKGFWNFTIGQRKGLSISSEKPLYVIGIRRNSNEIVVGNSSDNLKKHVIIRDCNWIYLPKITKEMKVKAKYRSFQDPIEAILSPSDNNDVNIEFLDLQKALTTGQSVVLYDDDTVIGGGILDKVIG